MAENRLDVLVQGRDELSPVLSQLESKLIRFVGAVSSGIAAIKIGSFPITSAADFERELANVAKTTNFTRTQISQLGQDLKDLSLRIDVSATDLAKIAAAAGQQGLGSTGVEGVRQFTESVSRMASVLDITAEQAATDIGKILNIFKVNIKQVENVSSAFNQVSNNSTASGAQLLDIVKRIGDAAGTINLQQSLGLAATGVDFGLSPEVVGTSFAKIFSDMRAKADEFGKLMKMDAKAWIKIVDQDGIAALERYLTRLRQLDSASQAATINKLSGQGRIFALMNKLVQDSNNDLLRKNIDQARNGIESGTSAIKEQMTVLNTLKAQITVLRNSVFALGSETGDEMLKPLTRYVAQLSEALQNTAVKSFFRTIGESVVDLIDQIASLVKFVASLNINWENFVGVIKVFLTLKLIEFLGSMAARLPGVQLALQSIAKSAGEAGAAGAAAGKAGAKAADEQTTALQQVRAALRANLSAQIEAEAKEKELAAARAARRQAEGAASLAQGMVNKTREGVETVKPRLSLAAFDLNKAQTAGAESVAAARKALNDKLLDVERKHQATLAAIEQEFARKRSASNLAEKEALIAAEEAHNKKQIAGVNGYHNKRIALAEAQAAQQIAIAEAEFARLEAIYARSTAAHADAQAKLAAANANLASKNLAVDSAKASLGAAEAQAVKTGGALLSFGTIARGVGAVLGFLASALMNVVFWGTVIYSVLDALGIADKLGPMFTRLTDALGLTSEAKRKLAQQDKELAESQKKEKERVQELIDKYNEYKTLTGTLRQDKLAGLAAEIKQGGTDAQQRGLGTLSSLLEAANIQSNDSAAAIAGNPANSAKAKAELDQARANLDAAIATLKTAEESMNAAKNSVFPDAQTIAATSFAFKSAQEQVDVLAKKYKAAETNATAYTQQTIEGLQKAGAQANSNVQELIAYTSGLFTSESAKLFNDFVVPIQQQSEALAEMQKRRGVLMQEQIKFAPDSQEYADKAVELSNLNKQITEQIGLVAKSQEAFTKAREALSGMVKDSPVLANAVAFLDNFVNMSARSMAQIQVGLTAAQQTNTPLTGSALPTAPNKQTKGTDVYKPGGNTESEMAKIAKARLALEKAQIAAEVALMKERNSQILADDQYLYDRGIFALEDYFANRKRIQLQNNDAEIKAKQLDLKAIEKEKAQFTKESDKLRADADIARTQGEIAVLRAQKQSISDQIERDKQRASEAFRDRMTSTQVDLAQQLGTNNLDSFFGDSLENYSAQWRTFMSQLAASGEEGVALLQKLQGSLALKSLSDTFGVIGQNTELAYSALDRYTARLDIMQSKGLIAVGEYADLLQKARASAARSIEADIADQEKRLAALGDSADKTSLQYRKLQSEIDNSRVRLEQLKVAGNQIAIDINSSIKGGISSALSDSMNGGEGGIIGAARRLGLAIATTMQTAINNHLAETIMQSVFSGGKSGGIGGMVGDLLGMGDKKGPTGTATDPIYTASATDPTKALTGKDGIEGAITKKGEGLFDNISGFFANMKDKLGGIFSSMGDSLSGMLSSLWSALSDAFSSMSGGSGGGGGFLASAGSFIASLFHTGGVVGETFAPRAVSPALFANAVRYHSGGIAGLRPDEVPAVLRKGEEVLTANDPRHRNNGGGGGDVNMGDINVTVNTDGSVTANDAGALGKVIQAVVVQKIANERRPGGLLDPARKR